MSNEMKGFFIVWAIWMVVIFSALAALDFHEHRDEAGCARTLEADEVKLPKLRQCDGKCGDVNWMN